MAGVTLTFVTDPLRRLYSESYGGTRFLYDGAQVVAEYDTSGDVTARHVPGLGLDDLAVSYSGSGTSTPSYPLTDERGSVIAQTNSSGAVTATNTYDEYGCPYYADTGRFQYTGQLRLPGAPALYNYRTRTYDADLGRFLQPDTAGYGAGLNLYAYVGGDPVNLRDPWGLLTCILKYPDYPKEEKIADNCRDVDYISFDFSRLSNDDLQVLIDEYRNQWNYAANEALRRLADIPRRAFCSAGSHQANAVGDLGVIGGQFGVAYNTDTGDVFYRDAVSFGAAIGGDIGVGWYAVSDPVRGGQTDSTNSGVAAGLGPIGGGINYNHASFDARTYRRLPSSGFGGEVSVIAARGTAQINFLRGTHETARYLLTLPTPCH